MTEVYKSPSICFLNKFHNNGLHSETKHESRSEQDGEQVTPPQQIFSPVVAMSNPTNLGSFTDYTTSILNTGFQVDVMHTHF